MFFKKFLYYLNPLNLFKRNAEEGINLRMMHGINKISFFCLFGVLGRDDVPLVDAVNSAPACLEEKLPIGTPGFQFEVAQKG